MTREIRQKVTLTEGAHPDGRSVLYMKADEGDGCPVCINLTAGDATQLAAALLDWLAGFDEARKPRYRLTEINAP